MKRFVLPGLAASTILAAAAWAAPEPGTVVGTDMAEISAALVEMGYEVIEIEFEDGLFEAEAMTPDGLYELEIDPETGAIIEVELEDEDDDYDDEDDDEDEDDDA